MADAVRRADELSDELNAFRLDQFSDPANPEMHRRTTAEEIWQQTGGRVDVFVSAVGTGGTLIASVAPQSFNVTLPAMISNGVPQAGAGNLETAASEDQYRFTTTSAGSVKLAFSTCSAALGTVSWALVNASTGATVASNASSCATTTVPSMPGGFMVSVMGNAKIGTYKVTISKV